MRRRDFIVSLGGGLAWSLPLHAQQRTMPVIGYLGPEAPGPFASRIKAFRDGLAEVGYAEGRNVGIEFRWAEGRYDSLPELAADLVRSRVDVIVAPGGAPIALAAKAATATIPIIFEMGGDPVALGVVESLSQPGGNISGVSSLSVEVSRKRLEFMRDAIPTATLFAVVVNPTSPTAPSQLRNLHAAADSLGLRLHVLNASKEQEFEAVFTTVTQLRAGGLVFTSDPYFANRSHQLAALAQRHAIPAITQSRDFPVAGGLMSYGGDFTQSHRQAGIYVGRILKGERPANLPVQQVTKVELFLNMKAAAALGIAFPPSLTTSADEVIE
jgi:putative tryptophan/tyrosine transport system substrate-binding protein